ncbi:diacylglycerol/lipid kinase family protein [Aquimarina brevivitae]|uniref:diacylglycerol/lipid kinase family protein n=1 Tax=Aquimarina brevivitae TaxID=323412 RepID=UPI0013EEDFC6|nr:diacylglycerol kinase family protein [Aquimarina brevivitae]
METKILVVVNPISGDINKEPVIQKIKGAVSKKTDLKFYKTTGREDYKTLKELQADVQPDRILVVGGDGTVKLIAECFKNNNPTIGIIPCGSSNGLATDLAIPSNVDEAIQIALGNTFQNVDSLCINNSLGLHISDLGINAELIEHYSNSTVRGHFGYALNSIPTLLNTNAPYKFHIKTEENELSTTGIMLAFANSNKFGTGAIVNPTGKIDDGKFEILVFKKLDVANIIKILLGEVQLDPNFVEVIQTTGATVTTDKPVPFQVDGEPYGSIQSVEVAIQPNTLKIAVG